MGEPQIRIDCGSNRIREQRADMDDPPSIACEGEEFEFDDAGQVWTIAWHPPDLPPPSGKPHGSSAVCLAADGRAVLVSSDGGESCGK